MHWNGFSPLWDPSCVFKLHDKRKSISKLCALELLVTCVIIFMSLQVTQFWESITTLCALEWLLTLVGPLCVFKLHDKEKLFSHFVHLNCLSLVWIIVFSSSLILIIYCHTLSTGMASNLCGSSHVYSSYMIKRIHFHTLCTWIACLMCGLFHVFSSNLIKR